MANKNKPNKQNIEERKRKSQKNWEKKLLLLDVALSSSTCTRKWGGNTN
jgi:hypothetical protein